jgi:ribonuclease R
MVHRPLVHRNAIVEILAAHGRAMHVRELATRLGVESYELRALRDVLDELLQDGVVAALSGQRVRLQRAAAAGRGKSVEGLFHGNPRGFGFVRSPAGDLDLFIPPEARAGAMHGDRVVAREISRSNRGLEGEVVEVTARAVRRVAGTLRRRRASCWLEPDDERIRGPIVLAGSKPPEEAFDGAAAVVELCRYPEVAAETPEAELVAVLGEPGEPDVEVGKILIAHGVEDEHPTAVLDEVTLVDPTIDPAELARREDLTHLPFVTIDPADARDHDDAVFAERKEDGSYRAWIAIADVSHYVRPGTALDAEARRRSFSVYLPDRAIPMLPAPLSSDLCSLLPGEQRLCLCVEIELRATGTVRKARVIEGVMRSRARLSYEAVAGALRLSADATRDPAAEERRADLQVLWDLSVLLRGLRLRRGALDLDLPETRVAVDEASGEPTAVERRGHDPGVRKAYRLIEELMLVANERCARLAIDRELPAVFRVHAAPDVDKLDRFAALAHELGLSLDAETIAAAVAAPKALARFLRKLRRHPKASLLHGLLLRAMQQAGYDTVNIGHYGLASGAYLHFSSPIRRYPDLLVHRVLRAALRGDPIDETALAPAAAESVEPASQDESRSPMRAAAMEASTREREVMEVERQVVDLYCAMYMQSRIGERFQGTVSGIATSGVFLRLDEPFVDVMVPMEALGGEAYEMDDLGLRAVGVRSGDRVELGDPMWVEIEDASLLRRTVYGRRVLDARDRRAARKRRTSGGRRNPRKEESRGKGSGRARGGQRKPRGRGRRRR